jgi:hypothetical protein
MLRLDSPSRASPRFALDGTQFFGCITAQRASHEKSRVSGTTARGHEFAHTRIVDEVDPMHSVPLCLARGARHSRAAFFLCALVGSQAIDAQAWLPAQGSFGTSVVFNSVLNLKHYSADGDETDAGHTRSEALGLSLAYSPTDRLMLNVGVPYLRTRYWGDRPHPGEIDNGEQHSTFTDLRISAHYQALLEPFALAPYIAFVTPVTDYETMGHSAPGRGLNETWVGFWIGKNMAQWLSSTYVQARYNYAFVEEVANISHDHSNLDVEVGRFLSRQWAIRAMCFMQFAHGGIDLPIPPSNPLFPHHDQLGAVSFTNVGLGVSYAASPTVSFYAMYLTSLNGENGHKLDQGVTFGISLGFTPLRERVAKAAP